MVVCVRQISSLFMLLQVGQFWQASICGLSTRRLLFYSISIRLSPYVRHKLRPHSSTCTVIAMKGGHGHQLRRRSLLYYSSSKFVRSVKERSYIIISFPRSGATIPQQICKYCTAPAELWTLGLHCELWYKPLVVMVFWSEKQSFPSHPLFLFFSHLLKPLQPVLLPLKLPR